MLQGLYLFNGCSLQCNAGRVKDYGETPVKRARLALEGFTWGCPTLPTAADLAGMDEVMVAAEAAMSQQAAELAAGTHVEYRSREPYLIGGWFRAQIVQVLAHSPTHTPTPPPSGSHIPHTYTRTRTRIPRHSHTHAHPHTPKLAHTCRHAPTHTDRHPCHTHHMYTYTHTHT